MRSSRSLAVAACLLGFASVGTCQDVPRAELTAGYSFLYDDSFSASDSDGAFPLGWHASATFPISPLVGAVVDLSGHYKSDDGESDDVEGFHGGIRLSERASEKLTPYVQLLAGVTRGSAQGICSSGSTDAGCGVYDSDDIDFSIQPGVGAIVRVSDRVGIDVGGDYRLVFSEEKAHEFRVHVGVAFLLGRK